MRFPYQYDGTGLIRYAGPATSFAPHQTRAAPGAMSGLGSLGDSMLTLPAPGAPEAMNGDDLMESYPMRAKKKCGCGCKGKKKGGCGPKGAMGAIPVVDDIANVLQPTFGTATTPIVLGGLAYLAYRLFFKKKS